MARRYEPVFLFRDYVASGRNGYYVVDKFYVDGQMAGTAIGGVTKKLAESVAGALWNTVRRFVRMNKLAPGRKPPREFVEPRFEVVQNGSRSWSVRDVTDRNRDMIGPAIPTEKVARIIAGELAGAVFDFRTDNGMRDDRHSPRAEENRLARKILAQGGDPTTARRYVSTPTLTRGVETSGHYEEWTPTHEIMARRRRVGSGSREWTRPLAVMEERAGLAKKNKRPAKKRAKRAPARRRTRR